MQPEKRLARLTGSEEPEIPGGGIPLPGAFHDVLYYLLNNGNTPSDILVKVIRDAVGEELNGSRVRLVWGTPLKAWGDAWENLAADIFAQLEERKLITPAGFDWWALSDDFPVGKRVYVLYYPNADGMRGHERDLRVIVRSKQEREIREKLARARSRIGDYQLQLEASGLYQGAIRATLNAHMQSLQWKDGMTSLDDGNDYDLPVLDRSRPSFSRSPVTRFGAGYLRERYPDWVTSTEVAQAYNQKHPEKPISVMAPFERLMSLVKWGQAERKDERALAAQGYRGRPKAFFRWKPEKE